jgi:hypothetical protein
VLVVVTRGGGSGRTETRRTETRRTEAGGTGTRGRLRTATVLLTRRASAGRGLAALRCLRVLGTLGRLRGLGLPRRRR